MSELNYDDFDHIYSDKESSVVYGYETIAGEYIDLLRQCMPESKYILKALELYKEKIEECLGYKEKLAQCKDNREKEILKFLKSPEDSMWRFSSDFYQYLQERLTYRGYLSVLSRTVGKVYRDCYYRLYAQVFVQENEREEYYKRLIAHPGRGLFDIFLNGSYNIANLASAAKISRRQLDRIIKSVLDGTDEDLKPSDFKALCKVYSNLGYGIEFIDTEFQGKAENRRFLYSEYNFLIGMARIMQMYQKVKESVGEEKAKNILENLIHNLLITYGQFYDLVMLKSRVDDIIKAIFTPTNFQESGGRVGKEEINGILYGTNITDESSHFSKVALCIDELNRISSGDSTGEYLKTEHTKSLKYLNNLGSVICARTEEFEELLEKLSSLGLRLISPGDEEMNSIFYAIDRLSEYLDRK